MTMAGKISTRDEPFAPREVRLTNALASYVSTLADRAPGTISFRTGGGRLLRDLLLHWPVLDGLEAQAQELCRKITEAVYPLVANVFAQGVDISITISSQSVDPPAHIDALSTYVLFDGEKGVERVFFLSPDHELPEARLMRARKGIEVLSRPLNYMYHKLRDDNAPRAEVRIGIFELPKRMLDELFVKFRYDKPAFDVIKTLLGLFAPLSSAMMTYYMTRSLQLAVQTASDVAKPVIGLFGLPPPLWSFENRLMGYVMDDSLNPELRLGLRRVAQTLRGSFPAALIDEAARAETQPHAHPSRKDLLSSSVRLNQELTARRKYASLNNAPVNAGESGKLQNVAARASMVTAEPHKPAITLPRRHIQTWQFLPPSPEPFSSGSSSA